LDSKARYDGEDHRRDCGRRKDSKGDCAGIEVLKRESGVIPGLAVVLWIDSERHTLPESASEVELLRLVDTLNKDSRIHRTFIWLPLPHQIGQQKVINAILREKMSAAFILSSWAGS